MEKLTGRPAPKWLNRAAGIGVALPCVVPRDWISPPEYDDEEVNGELVLDEEDERDYDERSRMLREDRRRQLDRKASKAEEEEWSNEVERIGRGSMSSGESSRMGTRGRYMDEYDDDEPPRLVRLKDVGGSNVPPAERAPLPRGQR